MTSNDLLYEYRWAIAAAIVGLYLIARYITRRLHERREAQKRLAVASGERPLVSPERYSRARKQFLLTLALLIVIVTVSILTRFV